MIHDVDVTNMGVPMSGGYGCGTGGFGGGFGAGFVGGLFGTALTRGFRGDCDKDGDKDFAYLLGRDSGLQAKTSDIVAAAGSIEDTTRSTGAAIINNLNHLDGKLNAQGVAMLQGFSTISKELCDNRHESDMHFAKLMHEQAMATCAINLHTTQEGEKTRAQAMLYREQDNERRYEDIREERNFLKYGHFPLSQSAHVVKHEHAHDPRDTQIQVINQNVNAIGSTVTQLAGAVQSLLKAAV